MSGNGHIVFESNGTTVPQKYTRQHKMRQKLREVQIKLMRGLLDLIILQFLSVEPMHGYRVITSIRRNFGVYFGPSTIYPLLGILEEKGYITRTRSEKDNRVVIVELTPSGRELIRSTPLGGLPLLRRRLADLSQGRLSEIDGVLTQIAQLMEAGDVE